MLLLIGELGKVSGLLLKTAISNFLFVVCSEQVLLFTVCRRQAVPNDRVLFG